MGWFLVWLIGAILIGALASKRDRSGFGWFVLALIISPLLAGLGLLIAGTGGQHVRCPACREQVRADAVKCKHCGEALAGQAPQDVAELAAYHRTKHREIALALLAVAAVFALLKLLGPI